MEKTEKKVFTVLCIDGGGVRGVIPARILQEIEERTGKPIAEMFDMVGGTSTGAIIGACLLAPSEKDPAKPRHTARETLNFYHGFAGKVFPEMRFKSLRKLSAGGLYDPRPLEASLLERMGSLQMKDTLKSFIIPVVDIKNFRPAWISHVRGQKDTSKEGWSTMMLRDAVRSATAAPTYFPICYVETTPNPAVPDVKYRHALLDGGFFGGNAMPHLLAEAKKLAPPDAEIVLVHLGTGSPDRGLSPEEFNALGPLGLINASKGNILMSLFLSMGTRDSKETMAQSMGNRFFTFDEGIRVDSGPDVPAVSLDDARPDNLRKLEKHAEKIIANNEASLDRLCEILKTGKITVDNTAEVRSRAALQKLADKLAEANTIKMLSRTYLRFVHLGHGIPQERPGDDDAEVKQLLSCLTDPHKAELTKIYGIMMDKKQHESKLLNAIKEAGKNITDMAKDIFVDPFKNDAPPPANDDRPPKPPKYGTDGPKGP